MTKVNLFLFLFLCLIAIGQAGVEAPPQLQNAIRALSPGYSVTYESNINIATTASYTIISSGPPIILSDDPERVYNNGILARESIGTGTARIYIYNSNYTSMSNFKITVVLKNLSTQTGSVIILKKGSAPPGNYYLLGKTLLYNYYTSTKSQEIRILPLDSAILDPILETNYATGLTHGFYEIYSQQSTQITICGLPFTDNSLKTYTSLTVLGAVGTNAGRGLFPNSDRKITLNSVVDTRNGIQRVPLADWGINDPWIQGIDSLTGKTGKLDGNYGVMYTINLPMQSTDNRDMAILVMCPVADTGGCPYGGVIGTDTAYNLSPAGYFYTPSDLKSFTNPTTASLVGIYRLRKTPATITLQFSPPGGSCLPACLLLVPIDKNNPPEKKPFRSR